MTENEFEVSWKVRFIIKVSKKVKISLLHAMEAHRVARG
jgi:hypothetical protein